MRAIKRSHKGTDIPAGAPHGTFHGEVASALGQFPDDTRDSPLPSPSAMGMPDGHPATTEVTVLLKDLGGRTKMVMTHAGMPADSGAGSGWEQAFDKLADHIEKMHNK